MKPRSRALTQRLRLHGEGGGGVGEHVGRVPGGALPLEVVALEVDPMDVPLGAQAKDVPHHLLPLTQLQTPKVPVHQAVDR